LWIFAEEQYGLGGGVDEAAGVRVRHLGQGEPGPLPGRGRNLHRCGSGSGSKMIHNNAIYKIFIIRTQFILRSIQSARLSIQSSELGPTHFLTRKSVAYPPPPPPREKVACGLGGGGGEDPNSNDGTNTLVL
jgi:hypothetical protein